MGINRIRYWALKTRDLTGPVPVDNWSRFLTESVIAIGWPAITVSPETASLSLLTADLQRTHQYSPILARRVAKKIQSFCLIRNGDLVLICQGYPANQRVSSPVHLYGIARVGTYFQDPYIANSGTWRFKHRATIQSFGQHGLYVPKNLLVRTLAKESLMQALHEIEEQGFKRLMAELHHQY